MPTYLLKKNSLYDSLRLLSTLIKEKPREMCSIFTDLSLEKIDSKDQAILREYIKVIDNCVHIRHVFEFEYYWELLTIEVLLQLSHLYDITFISKILRSIYILPCSLQNM